MLLEKEKLQNLIHTKWPRALILIVGPENSVIWSLNEGGLSNNRVSNEESLSKVKEYLSDYLGLTIKDIKLCVATNRQYFFYVDTEEETGERFVPNLPTWETVKTKNDQKIADGEYQGFCWRIPVALDMFLLIDCQNDSVLTKGDNVIRFAWCNKAGFAIASIKYEYSEGGYLSGCDWLMESASYLAKTFSAIMNQNCKRIDSWIADFNQKK